MLFFGFRYLQLKFEYASKLDPSLVPLQLCIERKKQRGHINNGDLNQRLFSLFDLSKWNKKTKHKSKLSQAIHVSIKWISINGETFNLWCDVNLFHYMFGIKMDARLILLWRRTAKTFFTNSNLVFFNYRFHCRVPFENTYLSVLLGEKSFSAKNRDK